MNRLKDALISAIEVFILAMAGALLGGMLILYTHWLIEMI